MAELESITNIPSALGPPYGNILTYKLSNGGTISLRVSRNDGIECSEDLDKIPKDALDQILMEVWSWIRKF